MSPGSDRNLLFGVLALQLDYVVQEQLIDAAAAWMLAKDKPLGEIMVELDVLSCDDRDFLETVVNSHIARTGSAKASLERMSANMEASDTDSALHALRTLSSDEEYGPSTTVPFRDDSLVRGKRYRLLRKLARGGLGQVSVARDSELDREVALKEILANQSGSQEARQRFVSEARITGGLEHPGIVPIYSVGRTQNGMPYYAMRLIRGRSMHEEIESFRAAQGKIDRFAQCPTNRIRTLLFSLTDACNAVAYAHNRGVIHRDIKPSNVMLGKYGETLVVDWGLAKVLEDSASDPLGSEPVMKHIRPGDSLETEMGTVVGTPGYMSPEQAAGRLDLIDHRSDVFGLGACLYSILTGCIPYQCDSREDTVAAARSHSLLAPCEIDKSIPKSIEAVCLKAMAQQREDRYQTPIELASDLERWIAGEAVSAISEPWLQTAWRWARKHQTIVASCLLLMIAGLIGLAVANRAIGFQRDQADAAREQAESARQRAELSNDVSIEILEEFVKRLADDRWSQVPQLEGERLKMLQLASDRYETLLDRFPEDIRLRRKLISLQLRSANLLRLMGEIDRAKRLMDQVMVTLEQGDNLHWNTSDIPVDKRMIGDALNGYLKLVIDSEGNLPAVPYVEQELALRRELHKDNPSRAADQYGLLQSLIFASEVGLETDNAIRSETEAQEAILLGDALSTQKISNKTMQLVVDIYRAHARCILGSSLAMQDKSGDASKAFRVAIDLQEANLETYINQPDVRDFCAKPQVAWAQALWQANERERARELAAEALTTYEALIVEFPGIASHKQSAADIVLMQAMWHHEDGDTDNATARLKAARLWLQDVDPEGFSGATLLLLVDTISEALSDSISPAIDRKWEQMKSQDPFNRRLRQIDEFRKRLAL